MCAGDAHSQEVMRKRDKKKVQAAVKAVRMKQHRLLLKTQAQRMERLSGRLRERQRWRPLVRACYPPNRSRDMDPCWLVACTACRGRTVRNCCGSVRRT